MRRGWHRDALVLLPALLFLALHARTLDYGLVWTDVPEIAHGSILRPAGRILHAFGEPLHAIDDFATCPFTQPYYRPLQVVAASALAHAFWREARPLRVLTLALGAATALLFTALAAQLLGSRRIAALAGAIFAVHPVGLEIYVWVGGLAAALAGGFAIASLLAATRGLRATSPGRRRALFALSCAALVGALLSKETAAVVPALLAALILSLHARDRHAGEAPFPARAAAALLVLQLGLLAAYLFALRPAVLGTSLTGNAPIGGRLATQWASHLASWPEQLAWLVLPWHSTTSDALQVVPSLLRPGPLLGLALAGASAAAWLWLLRRGQAVAALGLAWVWLAFLPGSGLVPLLHARSERNLFLPVFGAALLLASLAPALRRRGAPTALVVVLTLAYVAVLAERSWRRQPAWRSTTELFERDVAADPRHREGRLNLIVAYAERGRFAAAKPHVDALLDQRAPVEWTSYALEANLLEAACLVNAALGRDEDTLRAVAGDPPPTSASAVWHMPGFYACYAPALLRLDRPAEALPLFEALRRGASGPTATHFALGSARSLAALGRREEARDRLSRIAPEQAREAGLADEIARLRRSLAR